MKVIYTFPKAVLTAEFGEKRVIPQTASLEFLPHNNIGSITIPVKPERFHDVYTCLLLDISLPEKYSLT
jgi:hypothetical protein